MANSVSHASLPYPIKNARYTIFVPFLDADGDPTDPTTPDTEVSQDGGAYADAAEEVTTITGSNGSGYITLTGAETNNSVVGIAFKVASGPKATLAALYPRNLPILESGTAGAGAAGSITLAAGTYTGLNLAGCFIRTTGGTGGGGTGGANNQARRITAYNTSTRVATVTPNWETTPDATTTYDILLPEGVLVPMLTALPPTTLGRTLTIESDGMAHADVKEVAGTNQTAGDLAALITTVDDLLDTEIAAILALIDTEVASILADTDELQQVLSAGIFARSNNATLNALLGVPDVAGATAARVIHSGTAQAGSTNSTLKLAASASAIDGFYTHRKVEIVSGTGVGQIAVINSYSGTTKTASTMPNWYVTPDATSVYAIFDTIEAHVRQVEPGVISSSSFAAGAINATVAPNLDATVSSRASQTSVNTIDDFIDTEIAEIIASLAALDSALAIVDGNVDAILLDTGTDGVPLTAAAVDAIHDEAISEPSGRPAWASMTHRKIMQTLGVLMLNEIDSDSNSVDVRNDLDTVNLWSYPSSDDGSTYISGKAS